MTDDVMEHTHVAAIKVTVDHAEVGLQPTMSALYTSESDHGYRSEDKIPVGQTDINNC